MSLRKTFLEARLTYLVYVRSGIFRLILVLGIIGILLLFNSNKLAFLFGDENSTKVAVIMNPVTTEVIQLSEFQDKEIEFVSVPRNEFDSIVESLNSTDQVYLAVLDMSDSLAPTFHYNEQMSPVHLQKILSSASQMTEVAKYHALGISPEMIQQVMSSRLQILGYNTVDRNTITLVANLLMFFTLFIYVVKIGDIIIEEKTARISETLLSYIKPSELLFGKLLGMFLSLMTHLVAFVGVWLLASTVFEPSPFAVRIIQAFEPQTLLMMLGMLLAGYLVYGLLYAANSSQARTVQETGQAQIVQSVLIVISFYIALVLQMHYDPSVMAYLKYIPVLSIFANIVYVAVEQPGDWQTIGLILLHCLYAFVLAVPLINRFRKGITNYARSKSSNGGLYGKLFNLGGSK